MNKTRAAIGCGYGGSCGCDDSEEVAPITTELRDSMAYVTNTFSGDDEVRMDEEEFIRLCDNIDAIHAGLERDYATACRVNEQQDLEYIDLAKRYDNTISLPLDADGVPIRIGDVMDFTKNVRGLTVLGIGIVDASESSLGEFGLGVFVREGNDYGWYNAEFLHHHVPTVEDVLDEMLQRFSDDSYEGGLASFIAEYAAKLKLADA